MNYFNPNVYQNYPYGNTQFFNPYQQTQQNSNNMNNQLMSLNGKIVDTIDMAKVTEVPIGGYGIFPKADLSEIYVKAWNQNGSTNMITFKPALSEDSHSAQDKENTAVTAEILQRINNLELKIDSLMKQANITNSEKSIQNKVKKEFNLDDY